MAEPNPHQEQAAEAAPQAIEASEFDSLQSMS